MFPSSLPEHSVCSPGFVNSPYTRGSSQQTTWKNSRCQKVAISHKVSSTLHLRKESGCRACSSRPWRTMKNARFVLESSQSRESRRARTRTVSLGRFRCRAGWSPWLTLSSISEVIARDPRCPMVSLGHNSQRIYLTPFTGSSEHRVGGLDRATTRHGSHPGTCPKGRR